MAEEGSDNNETEDMDRHHEQETEEEEMKLDELEEAVAGARATTRQSSLHLSMPELVAEPSRVVNNSAHSSEGNRLERHAVARRNGRAAGLASNSGPGAQFGAHLSLPGAHAQSGGSQEGKRKLAHASEERARNISAANLVAEPSEMCVSDHLKESDREEDKATRDAIVASVERDAMDKKISKASNSRGPSRPGAYAANGTNGSQVAAAKRTAMSETERESSLGSAHFTPTLVTRERNEEGNSSELETIVPGARPSSRPPPSKRGARSEQTPTTATSRTPARPVSSLCEVEGCIPAQDPDTASKRRLNFLSDSSNKSEDNKTATAVTNSYETMPPVLQVETSDSVSRAHHTNSMASLPGAHASMMSMGSEWSKKDGTKSEDEAISEDEIEYDNPASDWEGIIDPNIAQLGENLNHNTMPDLQASNGNTLPGAVQSGGTYTPSLSNLLPPDANLIEAELVPEERSQLFVSAVQVDPNEENENINSQPIYQHKQFSYLAGGSMACCCLVIVAVVVGVVAVALGGDSDTPVSSMPPSAPPSTAAPTTISPKWLEFEAMVAPLLDDPSQLANSTSPYSKAMHWMVYEDLLEPSTQRYLLAAFYFFASQNEEWETCSYTTYGDVPCMHKTYNKNKNGFDEEPASRWLSAVDECTWAGVGCHGGGGSIKRIVLDTYNLNGIILPEIGQLSGLTNLEIEYSQNLIGSLPTSLRLPPNLHNVDLTNNGLSGTIPDELCDAVDMKRLRLAANAFEGTIPLCLWKMTRLDELKLDENNLTGNIPSELGLITTLAEAQFDSNNLRGTVPAEICALSQGVLTKLRVDCGSDDVDNYVGCTAPCNCDCV